MQKILESVEQNSYQVNEKVNGIIGDSTKEMDEYIGRIRNMLLTSSDINDEQLNRLMLEIPIYIYYLTRILQDIDVRKGVSLENAKYEENQCLLESTGTVVEKQAKANNSTIRNRVVSLAFKSATGLIQGKINAAMEILSSAKKIHQRRLEDLKLAKLSGNSVASF